MLRRELFLRTAEVRAAYKRRLRVMAACYSLLMLGGVASFALKPATTSASVTITYSEGALAISAAPR